MYELGGSTLSPVRIAEDITIHALNTIRLKFKTKVTRGHLVSELQLGDLTFTNTRTELGMFTPTVKFQYETIQGPEYLL